MGASRVWRTTAAWAVLVAWLAPAGPAAAMYKCQRDGQTIISDKPCPKTAPVGDVDPTRPAPKQDPNARVPLVLEPGDDSRAGGSVATVGGAADLSAAGNTCLKYHRAMVSGNKAELKNLATSDRAADIDRIPASSFSAMTKVMPAAAAVDRIDGDPGSGRALVKMRATSGKSGNGYCTTTLEDGHWKVLKQDWDSGY